MSGVRVAAGCSSVCLNRFYHSVIFIFDNTDPSSQDDDDDYAVAIVTMENEWLNSSRMNPTLAGIAFHPVKLHWIN